MKQRRYPLILFMLAALSCNHPAAHTEPLSAEERVTIATEVSQTLHDYCKDIAVSGLTAEFNYLDNSPDFFWVPPNYSGAISFDSVSAILQQNAPLFNSINNHWDTLRVIPLSSDLATYTGQISSTMIDTAGQVTHMRLIETGMMIKRKKGWKLLCGQTGLLSSQPEK